MPAAVTTVRFIVTGDGLSTPLTKDFAANLHSGSLASVPVGTSRFLTLQGLDSSGNLLYVGASNEVAVTKGQTTNCGAVTMRAKPAASNGIEMVGGINHPLSAYLMREQRIWNYRTRVRAGVRNLIDLENSTIRKTGFTNMADGTPRYRYSYVMPPQYDLSVTVYF